MSYTISFRHLLSLNYTSNQIFTFLIITLMKQCLIATCILICAYVHGQESLNHSLKAGAGYAKDFPGLGGYGLTAEYVHLMTPSLEGGFAFKYLSMTGTPRTLSTKEYTRATTLDFNLYFVPLANEVNAFKIGLGYSFSFYKTRRTYPVVESNNGEKFTTWRVADGKGRLSGLTVNAEYEYTLPSNVALGIKASLCKAYDQVFYIGPFVGVKL